MGGLVGASALWTAAALFQAFARDDSERWTWFALSTAADAALLWQLWGPVLHQGEIKGGKNFHDYRLLAAPSPSWWSPTRSSWLVGEVSLKLISSSVDLPILLVVDLASDAGLGIPASCSSSGSPTTWSPSLGDHGVGRRLPLAPTRSPAGAGDGPVLHRAAAGASRAGDSRR